MSRSRREVPHALPHASRLLSLQLSLSHTHHSLPHPHITGVLIKRPPEVLARDVDSGYYYVYTRDDTLLACAQLKRYSTEHAELACLVVAPQYRRQGCGDAMLGFLERTAVAAGVSNVFALSTHTMQWFVERGFGPVETSELPPRSRS